MALDDEFVAQRPEEIVNFTLVEQNGNGMVFILIILTRPKREGICDLYLHSFRPILPYFLSMIISIMQDGNQS